MHYLDVLHLGQEISHRFQKVERDCEVHMGLTGEELLSLVMRVFFGSDLKEMREVARKYNVEIVEFGINSNAAIDGSIVVALKLKGGQEHAHTHQIESPIENLYQ